MKKRQVVFEHNESGNYDHLVDIMATGILEIITEDEENGCLFVGKEKKEQVNNAERMIL